MLLFKKEEENITHTYYESSNVIKGEYNDNLNEFTVTFKNGHKYKYKSVPKKDYIKFELCESQGKEIHKFKRFNSEKIGVVDVESIEQEIDNVKSKYHVELVNQLSDLVGVYSKNLNKPLLLTKIENKLNQIKEII